MKRVLKYTGVIFLVLIGLGILGNLLGVETETAQPESEQAKAEKETEAAEKEAQKLAEEQAKAEEEAAKQAEKEAKAAEKEAQKLAEEQAKAEEEAAKQAEKEAKAAEKEAQKLAEEQAKAEEAAKEKAQSDWQATIATLAANEDKAADKFYALERFMMEYDFSKAEVETFTKDIIADYKSGTYLNELTNHERMLTNIFKAYVVEKGAAGAVVDFAFDYYQNLKYTYRGVDAVDSQSVKSNESQMDRALSQM